MGRPLGKVIIPHRDYSRGRATQGGWGSSHEWSIGEGDHSTLGRSPVGKTSTKKNDVDLRRYGCKYIRDVSFVLSLIVGSVSRILLIYEFIYEYIYIYIYIYVNSIPLLLVVRRFF